MLKCPLLEKQRGHVMELKMTLKEANRLEIMRRKERKEISLLKASEELGLCYRQTQRR